MIEADDIIIDAKSGVSGAGREAREASLFAEVGEGVHAYGIAHHRHAPEIEQGLSAAAGSAVRVNFTPHLMPMNRGILATIYVRSRAGADVLREALAASYSDEPFVRVLAAGHSACDAPRARLQPLPHRRLRRPHRGPRHPDLGHRQPGSRAPPARPSRT